MSKKLFLFVLIVLTVINLSATITILYERWSRKPPPFAADEFDPALGERMRKRLDLTPRQMKEIRESLAEHRQNIWPIVNEYDSLRRILLKEISADSPHVEKIDNIVLAMGELQNRIQLETIHHILRGRDFLDLQQREHLHKMFLDRMESEFNHPMFRHMQKGPRWDRHRRPFGDDSMRLKRNRNNSIHNDGGAL